MMAVFTMEARSNLAAPNPRAGFPVGYKFPLFREVESDDVRAAPLAPDALAEIIRQADAAQAMYAEMMPAPLLASGNAGLRAHVLALAALARAWRPEAASHEDMRIISAAEGAVS
jgi:hypothetical protein